MGLEEIKERYRLEPQLCYQCLKCSYGCPAVFAMDHPPHQVVRAVALGLEEVLGWFSPWVCTSCQICTTRCPNGIEISRVMEALREESPSPPEEAREVVLFHRAFAQEVAKRGRVHELSLMRRYLLQVQPWRKGYGELRELVGLGWKMFKRGKISLLPRRVRRMDEVKGAMR